MYLASFELESQNWVQAVARWAPASAAAPDFEPLLAVPEANLSVRFDFHPPLNTALVAVATPAKFAPVLQAAVQTWADKTSAAGLPAKLAASAGERDAWMDDLPPLRMKAGADFRAENVPLLCNYLVFPMAEEMFAAAAAANKRLLFQANCRKFPLDQRALGQMRKQLVRLEALGNAPARLLAHQRETLGRMANFGWVADEFLAVQSANDRDWVEAMVRDDFSATFAALGFPPVTLPDDGGLDNFLGAGFHGSFLDEAESPAARLRGDELLNLLQLRLPDPAPPAVTIPPAAGALSRFDVFVSHSSKDRNVANAVCHYLENAGIRCWIAPREIRPGELWPEAIPRGIRASRVLVVIFSENSNLSRHVLREVERAVHFGLTIVPFRIEESTMTEALAYLLAPSHWLDALTPPLEAHLKRLVSEIQQHFKSEPPPPSNPAAN